MNRTKLRGVRRLGKEDSALTKTSDIGRKGIYCPDCGHWNIPERKSCEKCESALPKRTEHDLKTLITILALVVSVIALIPAAFQAYEAYQTTKVQQANLRPLVEAQIYNHVDEKSIDLLIGERVLLY